MRRTMRQTALSGFAPHKRYKRYSECLVMSVTPWLALRTSCEAGKDKDQSDDDAARQRELLDGEAEVFAAHEKRPGSVFQLIFQPERTRYE